MQLGFLYTGRCNAKCLHCTTSCGPENTETLSESHVFRLMDEAAAIDSDNLQFCLSGGEPFLNYAALRRIVAHGASKNAKISCVSNAYWASDDEKAVQKLRGLVDVGLSAIAISTSDYHREFIPFAKVRRALEAAKAIELPCILKYAYSATSATSPEKLKQELGSVADYCVMEAFELLPTLRDGVILPPESYRRTRGLPAGTCPAAVVTVREDGMAYMCCTPGGFVTALSLGDTREVSLSTINDRFLYRGIPRLLKERGPAYFGHRIASHQGAPSLRPSYSNVCDLCTHLMGDERLARMCEQIADDAEIGEIAALVESLTATTTT